VFANVGGLVITVIVLTVLKVVGCWCCLNQKCSLYFVLLLRLLSLAGTIIAFVFVGTEQKAIQSALATATFGTFWQQYLVVGALGFSVLMVIIGGLLGALQAMRDSRQLINIILLIADSLCAIGLGAASIAAANVGDVNYVLLRQSIAAMFTMAIYLMIMLVDAAHAFDGEEDDSSGGPKTQQMSTYKPTQNKTSYKPSGGSKATTPRREAPEPPSQSGRARPKSTRGEILVALYDYQGQEADELDFEEGARIELVEDHADGWASGIVLSSMQEGLFPLNYTEKES